jgi:hypothetical protein
MITPWYPRTGEIPLRLETCLRSEKYKTPDPSETVRQIDSAALRFAMLFSIADAEFRESNLIKADWLKCMVKQFTEMRPLRPPQVTWPPW